MQIAFSKDAVKLIILSDYLHPEVQPKEFALQAFSPKQSEQNYYSADLNSVNQFSFLGFVFKRAP